MQQWHQVFLAEFAVSYSRSTASCWSSVAGQKRKAPAKTSRQAS